MKSLHTRSEYFSDVKVFKLSELDPHVREEVAELLTGVDEDKVRVYKLNYTPMRLQELFSELYKRGCKRIVGSIVASGHLYVVCVV